MRAKTEYYKWLKSPRLSDEERAELLSISDDEVEIESRFHEPLRFGTAGLRGIMSTGLARMNIHVVRWATQAMAELMLLRGGGTCAVCYDCREHSREFAEAAAGVLAANGLHVRIFDDMRPTPEISFAIRHYGCIAGINITASHNPKEYNGYKVYWADGAQLPPEHAAEVAGLMEATDIFEGVRYMSFEDAQKAGLITVMGRETDEAYLQAVLCQSFADEAVKSALAGMTVVYTPFHGAGRELVPEVLSRIGVGNIVCVPEQMVPDGSFPTVFSPNPENPEGFALAVKLAKQVKADLIIGTDPDSDRVGMLISQGDEYVHMSGNQTGVLLTDYILGARKRAGRLPNRPAVIKTIVTTELARCVAESYGAECYDTFTGFKYMAELIKKFEETGGPEVVFSFEESFGYMPGTDVRDKDGVSASMLIAEMAAYHISRGGGVMPALEELWRKFGFYDERTRNILMEGVEGQERIRAIMQSLRSSVPSEIGGIRVEEVRDYLPEGSDVLRFSLEGGTMVLVRPSGTEPKLKIYTLARGETADSCAEQLRRTSDFLARWIM